MVDLTSSLYLGMSHPSAALRPWLSLTLGRPAALAVDARTSALERRVAWLIGTEAAALARSTTHMFVDLTALADPRSPMLLDAGAYPALRWGAQRAAGVGYMVRTFARADVGGLENELSRRRSVSAGALILTDGLCTGCGAVAPIAEYLALAHRHGGHVIIDDTQAIGILGTAPRAGRPWGSGGGGTGAWLGVSTDPALVVVASLAKALGVPIATVAGATAVIERWRGRSETLVHSSPPTSADLGALDSALTANQCDGDRLRRRLLANIRAFRGVLSGCGVSALGGLHPIQAIAVPTLAATGKLARRLRLAGVVGVAQPGAAGSGRITFVITAGHDPDEVQWAAEIVGSLAPRSPSRRRGCALCAGGPMRGAA